MTIETENVGEIRFCRPRIMEGRGATMDGRRIALVCAPFFAVTFWLAKLAQEAGENGDLTRVRLMIGLFLGGVGALIAALYVFGLVHQRRTNREPQPPLQARAAISWSKGGTGTMGSLSLLNGALAFSGRKFDFVLPPEAFAQTPRASATYGLTARGFRLDLPGEFGRVVLTLTVNFQERRAIADLLEGMRSGENAVFPPLYRVLPRHLVSGGGWIMALFAIGIGGFGMLLRADRFLPMLAIGLVFGWIFAFGMERLERLEQRTAERAFRRLQSLATITP